MDTLLNKLGTLVNSTIEGFDRIIFRGIIRSIQYSSGMMSLLISQRVLNKDYKDWAQAQTKRIVESAERLSQEKCGRGVEYIPSLNTRKEGLAHARQEERKVSQGLIGVWSCVESCVTFKAVFVPESKYPAMRPVQSKCKHLYFYFADPVYGFMSIRLQTWAPYEAQVALNGREWLARSLDAAGCGYLRSGNKFLHIDDYGLAQQLLDGQAEACFKEALDGFLPAAFPCKEEVLGPNLSYYWTFWQTEVAKDYIFKDHAGLEALMDDIQLHAFITGKGSRILKYFGGPARLDGMPRKGADPQITSKTNTWHDGARVKHWCDKNSLKLYSEQNVLRFEMTMNNPGRFKIYRHAEGQDKSEPKKLRQMRKGVVDTKARYDISKAAIGRLTEHVAAFTQDERLGSVLSLAGSPLMSSGKKFRAVDAFGKDQALLAAVSDPANDVCAITNKGLQEALKGTPWAKGMAGRQLSSRISRHLRLLREHGLVRKLPNQRKYALTDKGRRLSAAVDAALATSVDGLLKLAA